MRMIRQIHLKKVKTSVILQNDNSYIYTYEKQNFYVGASHVSS